MNISLTDFEYMKECLARDILTILVEERGLSLADAFARLYDSETFSKMSTPATGLYFQSPRYVLSYIDAETKRRARFPQAPPAQ